MRSLTSTLIAAITALSFSGCASTPTEQPIFSGIAVAAPAPFPGMKPFSYSDLRLSSVGASTITDVGLLYLNECHDNSCDRGIVKPTAEITVQKLSGEQVSLHLSIDVDIGQQQTIRVKTPSSLQESTETVGGNAHVITDHFRVERDISGAVNEITKISLRHNLYAYVCVSPPMKAQMVPSGCDFSKIMETSNP